MLNQAKRAWERDLGDLGVMIGNDAIDQPLEREEAVTDAGNMEVMTR